MIQVRNIFFISRDVHAPDVAYIAGLRLANISLRADHFRSVPGDRDLTGRCYSVDLVKFTAS